MQSSSLKLACKALIPTSSWTRLDLGKRYKGKFLMERSTFWLWVLLHSCNSSADRSCLQVAVIVLPGQLGQRCLAGGLSVTSKVMLVEYRSWSSQSCSWKSLIYYTDSALLPFPNHTPCAISQWTLTNSICSTSVWHQECQWPGFKHKYTHVYLLLNFQFCFFNISMSIFQYRPNSWWK